MHRSSVMALVLVALMAVAVGAVPHDAHVERLVEGEIRGIVIVTYVDFEFEDDSYPGFTFHYEGTIEITTWPEGYQEITDCTGDAWITGSHPVYQATPGYNNETIASDKQSVRLHAFGSIWDPTASGYAQKIHWYEVSYTFRL